jgi:putative membrane protein
MMSGWHNGMDPGWWVLMSVLWVVLIGLIIWAAVRLFPSGHAQPPTTPQAGGENAKEILDRRLARGEIDTSTYDELRKRLEAPLAAGR